MKSVCEKCKAQHEGWWGTVRPLCIACFSEKKGLSYTGIIPSPAAAAAYGRTGRPKGTTEYAEPKENDTHRMTPAAHAYIRKNKALIEDLARKPHQVQWKMF